jgi:hypothetical protein
MFQYSSASVKAAIVTVKQSIEKHKDFIANSKDYNAE